MYVLSIDLHYTNLNISLKIEISIIKAEVKSNEIPHDIYMGSIIAINGKLCIKQSKQWSSIKCN